MIKDKNQRQRSKATIEGNDQRQESKATIEVNDQRQELKKANNKKTGSIPVFLLTFVAKRRLRLYHLNKIRCVRNGQQEQNGFCCL